jgi:hypothetical protein
LIIFGTYSDSLLFFNSKFELLSTFTLSKEESSIPNSLLITSFENGSYLMIGLRDGTFLSMKFTFKDKIEFSNSIKTKIGDHPINLSLVDSKKILLTSNTAWIVSEKLNEFEFQRLNINEVLLFFLIPQRLVG